MPRGTPRDYETTLAKTIRANCDKDLHNQINVDCLPEGYPDVRLFGYRNETNH